MGFVILFILYCLFNLIGYDYLSRSGDLVVLLFNGFQIIMSFIIYFFWNQDVKKKFIFLYFFIAWYVYNSLSFIRVSFIRQFKSDSIIETYYIIIASTILIFLGILATNKTKVKEMKLTNSKISRSTYYILAIFYLLYNIYMFKISGGFLNYFYSDYQSKIPGQFKTTIFILSGVFSFFKFLNLTYFFDSSRENNPKKAIVLFFFIFSAITVFASGASLGLLSLFLSIFLYKYCITYKKYEIKKIKLYIYMTFVVGILLAILVRFNRDDYSSFSLEVLNNTREHIFTSPTFDCTGNLIMIMKTLDPVYYPNQIIYPFVNFLPRAVFPWKPLELGRIISYKYYGFQDDEIGGFAPTPAGEFYYDFGIIGVVVFMFLLGYLLGFLQKKLNASKDTKWKWILLVTILSLVGTLPAWYTGFGVRLVYLVFFILMIYFVEYLVLKFGKR